MEKNYIFYSDYCQHSKKLINLLNENNLLNSYELCCVDDSDINLPNFITCVPTLYIVDQKRTLNDEALFHFINIEMNKNNSGEGQQQQMPQQMPQQMMPQQQQQQMMPQQQQEQMMPQQQQQQQMPQQQQQQQQMLQQQTSMNQNKSGPTDLSDIDGFHRGEMSSNYSDGYSFIDENSQIPHNYTFIDDTASSKIPQSSSQSDNQGQNQGGTGGGSQKGKLMDSAYEQMIMERTKNTPQAASSMRM